MSPLNYWIPKRAKLLQDITEEALLNTAIKVKGGYLDKWGWAKYTYGTLRNMVNER